MYARTGSRADSQLLLPFVAEPQVAGESARLLWIFAATPRDSHRIADYLRRAVAAASPGLLISLDDGTSPISLEDVVAFKVDDELRLFTDAEFGVDADLPDSIDSAFQKASLGRSRTRIAQECLFIRLVGGRQASGSADDCEHELGRSLALIRNADPRRDARFIHEVSGDLLDRLPTDASPVLRAMLRRLKAGAIYELCKSVLGFERGRLQEAALLYRNASVGFALGGLGGQADRCERDFRIVDELGAAYWSPAQLVLPGFGSQRTAVPHLRRLGFHAFRLLAIPLALASARRGHAPAVVRPSVLRPAGTIRVSERSMLRALDGFESTSLVPQLAVMPAGGLSKRLQLSVDREHLAMLGLPDRSRAERDQTFSFFAAARGWRVSPDHGYVRPGEPVELVAKAPSREAPPLQLVVHDGLHSSRFEVSAIG